MNNKIEPTYVDFNTAKLLKEKGFNEITNYNYSEVYGFIENINSLKHSDGNNRFVSAPEQWQVVEWLRVKHDIWVSITCPRPRRLELWGFFITKASNEDMLLYENRGYISPQEAYSAAFDYILKVI